MKYETARHAPSRHPRLLLSQKAQLIHEIRNPLTSIQASIDSVLKILMPPGNEILRQEEINTSAALLRIALRETERLSRLLSVEAEGAKSPPTGSDERGPLDVCHLVADVIEEVQLSLSATGKHITWRPLKSSLLVKANEDKLRQILWNLLLNAAQASTNHATISVGGEATRRSWKLWIEDEAGGLPDEINQGIFLASKTTKTHGMGIGLLIVHRLTSELGGEIRACKSKDGRGTRFELSFKA